MESFGAYLKAHREKRGIRLEEIASITKIHLHNLERLESGRWEQLPPEPFLRGFIIAYAKYVGLEPREAVTRYIEATCGRDGSNVEADARPGASSGACENPSEMIQQAEVVPSKKILIAAVLVLVIGAIGGITYLGRQTTNDDPSTPNLVSQAKPSPATSPSAVDNTGLSVPPLVAPDPNFSERERGVALAPLTEKAQTSPNVQVDTTQVQPPSDNKHELVIEGKERTWIKVVVDEDAPIEYFLTEGEKATYTAKTKIKVVLGNSTGSNVYHNGDLVPGVRYQGTIRSYIFPPDSKFPQDIPSKRSPSSSLMDDPSIQ